MRHGKKINHLGRTDTHRKAMLANMASSLIMHKRINTTVAKAKALRIYVEPLLTKAKNDTTHSRRMVFHYLQSKETVTELFREVAVKIADRPGGYTRIIKTGTRLGDNAEMCFIELVDYNDIYGQGTGEEKKEKTTRRGRGRGKKAVAAAPEGASEGTAAAIAAAAGTAGAPAAEVPAVEVKEDAPGAEVPAVEVKDDAPAAAREASAAPADETPAKEEAAPATEEVSDKKAAAPSDEASAASETAPAKEVPAKEAAPDKKADEKKD